MENFDEMKLYWQQLANKSGVDSETNRKILEAIRSNNYKSLKGKMIKERVIGLFVAVAMMIFLALYCASGKKFHVVTWTTMEILVFIAFIIEFLDIIFIDKMDFSESVTKRKEKLIQYKKWYRYSYYFAAIAVAVFVGVFLKYETWLYNPDATVRLLITISIGLPIVGCIFYLNHRHDMNNLKELEEIIDDDCDSL